MNDGCMLRRVILFIFLNTLALTSIVSILTRYGRLFHQFVVDMSLKMETTGFHYIKFNQQRFRIHLFQAISNSIRPSTFIGSPSFYKELYYDSMAIVRTDIFLTITCNPYWPEIQVSLQPGVSASDRPDSCARIFRLKLKSIIKSIETVSVD